MIYPYVLLLILQSIGPKLAIPIASIGNFVNNHNLIKCNVSYGFSFVSKSICSIILSGLSIAMAHTHVVPPPSIQLISSYNNLSRK